VLKQLTNHINSDQVRHYKRYCAYRERASIGRYKVIRTILRRVNEIKSEDSDIALRHVLNQCCPQHLGNEKIFAASAIGRKRRCTSIYRRR
jgi:hypothetical protein